MTTDNNHVVNLVDDYVYGLLEQAGAERVAAHCEECESCRAELEQAGRRQEALTSLPACEASEELIRGTLERIDRRELTRAHRRRGFVRTVVRLAAAAMLVIGCLHLYYRQLTPSPYDLHVFGQSEVLAGSNASLRIGLFDRSRGVPVAGIPVALVLFNRQTSEEVRLADFTTDAQGSGQPRFTLPDWDTGKYELRIVARTRGGAEEIVRQVTLRREWKLMLSTDKPLYQPGQTILVRGLSLRRPDLKPVAGQEAVFSITDPKGNVIFKRRDVTSRFGITSIECPLATEILEGPYTVSCQVGDTESAVTVQVEKYVLPKFKVALDLDRPFYQPGQRVKGTLQADYFFGKPVAGGEVSLMVQTTDLGPRTLDELTAKTDATGRAEFEFTLPERLVGREQRAGDAEVQVVAVVTDTASQKQTAAVSRVVSNEPIRIEVIPEAGSLVRGVSNRIYLFTSYADGRPARTRLAVSGHEEELTTGPLGIASFELSPDSGTVGLTLRATDPDGLVGRRHVQLTSGQTTGDFLLRTDKPVYRGGETIEVVGLAPSPPHNNSSPPRDPNSSPPLHKGGPGGVNDAPSTPSATQPIFLDLLKDNQTVLTQMVPMQAGRGEYQFDLPPDLFGTLQVCAYRFGPEGLPVMKTQTLYVHPAGELTIEATLDRPEYRPGEKARLRLRLLDEAGHPTPGAISLAAVDEAVFHVLSQRPGLERTFFNLERELLEPVYTIYNWSPSPAPPDDNELAERLELERALFALTAQPVAPHAADSSASSPLTLTAESYPDKVERVTARKQARLQAVTTAWWWLLGFVALSGIATFGLFKPKAFLITGAVGGGLLTVAGVVLGMLVVFAPKSDLARGMNIRMDNLELARTLAEPAAEMAWDGDEPSLALSIYNLDEPMSNGASAPVHVRRHFPETLLWRPELITDDRGEASLEVELADSITNWRLSASAVSAGGKLGGLQEGIRVFQPFFVDLNLPVALTRNDEVAVPVVVYNYLDEPQTVELTLEQAEWFELLGDADDANAPQAHGPRPVGLGGKSLVQRIELAPGEVRSTSYRLRAKQVGRQTLEVTARSVGEAMVADALRREIAVEPDGRRVEQVHNGALGEPAEIALSVPDEAIEGSVKAIVKLYPSGFSQLVEGLDAIFQMPSGCFEQTSSTTYPNVLALDYLRRTGKSVPEVEAKARQYIHLGYQRLLTFEVPGGGFDWFGRPPANATLTAYGLMEFVDMAAVHEVDPNLIERTRDWLLKQRKPDGSWAAERGMLNDGLAGAVQRGSDLDLVTTAYIGWAVFGKGASRDRAGTTLDYLLARRPESIDSPYTLALMANALLALDAEGSAARPYLDRLVALKQTDDGGKQAWWELGEGRSTTFYGAGRSGEVEVTALATLALLDSRTHLPTARAALTWLTGQRDGRGTWHSTQATVLALKALTAGSGTAGDEQPRIVVLALDGRPVRTVEIPADQAEVMQQIDLSALLVSSPHESSPTRSLTLADRTDTGTGYQVTFAYHIPETPDDEPQPGPLAVELAYDRTTLAVNDMVTATARVTNRMASEAPMVILDLPIPAGFRIETADLAALEAAGRIAKFQVTPRTAIIYLRSLPASETLELTYRLTATLPVRLTVPPATAYEYYDPDKRAVAGPLEMEVRAR